MEIFVRLSTFFSSDEDWLSLFRSVNGKSKGTEASHKCVKKKEKKDIGLFYGFYIHIWKTAYVCGIVHEDENGDKL